MGNHLLVQSFHILVVGVLFFYVGIWKTEVHKWTFPGLLGLGVIIVFYHAYKASIKKSYWINLLHIFVIGPTLMYIGYRRTETERMWFELVLMMAFAVVGYHGYYLATNLWKGQT